MAVRDDWGAKRDLAFFALELLDKATLFSKKEVLKECEKNKNGENLEESILNKSIYPNGEKLGFYNISKYTLNDLLNKNEIEGKKWNTLKEKFSLDYDKKHYNYYDSDAEEEFEKYLKKNSKEEYGEYLIYRKNLEEEFYEYIEGFSPSIKKLFHIIPGLYDELIYILKPYNKYDSDIVYLENTNNLNKYLSSKIYLSSYASAYIAVMLDLEEEYLNYYDLQGFLINILFDGFKFNEKTSVLNICPETTFIYFCLVYINEINPGCDIDYYVITPSDLMAFYFGLLSIFEDINFTYHIGNNPKNLSYEDYSAFFEFYKQFDFIFDSNYSDMDITGETNFSHYGIEVSSRIIYLRKFEWEDVFEDWLKKDLLESCILIPYKNTPRWYPFEGEDIYEYALLTVLNFQKSDKQKNKFLMVDDCPNHDISLLDYTIEDYRNLIDSNEIYLNSYAVFSEFIESDISKIIYNEDYLNRINSKDKFNMKSLFFNDEIYDVKMKSQKKYFEIGHFDGENRISRTLDYPIEKLGNIESEHYDIRSDNKENRLYFTNDIKNFDKLVFYDYEIRNESQYSYLDVNPELVSIQYLYYYMNSEMGKKEFHYHLRGRKSLSRHYLFMRVPIPPKEIQNNIVDALNKRDDLLKEMKLLEKTTNENLFDYKRNLGAIDEFYGKRNFDEETQKISLTTGQEHIYSGLIWPLAITYLIATSGGYEKTGRAKNLLRLFEFAAAFNSIVLISGIPEDVYQERKHIIWKYAYDKKDNDKKFVDELRLSFGSWVTYHYKLKKIYERRKFKTEINKGFYIKLLNSEILEDYQKLKEYRNKDAHGSLEDEDDAMELIEYLRNPKDKVFDYLNECYKNLKLYYTTKTINVEKDGDEEIFIHDVIFLNGPYSMPIYDIVKSKKRLKTESLYLHDILENRFTRLNDKLIKFKSLDKHDWRLYIFIGFITDNETGQKKARYKCYQRKEKNDYFEDIDLNELM